MSNTLDELLVELELLAEGMFYDYETREYAKQLILSEARRIGEEAIGQDNFKGRSIEERLNIANSNEKGLLDRLTEDRLRSRQRQRLLQLTGGKE